jgi:hypothetical protein
MWSYLNLEPIYYGLSFIFMDYYFQHLSSSVLPSFSIYFSAPFKATNFCILLLLLLLCFRLIYTSSSPCPHLLLYLLNSCLTFLIFLLSIIIIIIIIIIINNYYYYYYYYYYHHHLLVLSRSETHLSQFILFKLPVKISVKLDITTLTMLQVDSNTLKRFWVSAMIFGKISEFHKSGNLVTC